MTQFYSLSTAGFFDTIIHGERTLLVPDPEFQRPLITVTLQPGEALKDGSHLNETDAPITVEVPDSDTLHPLIQIPNPDCLLPSDAIEITHELYAELLAGNAQGKLIVADENGLPVLQEPPPPSSEQQAASASALRTHLLQAAATAIAPLQDAVDIGMATEAEQTKLNAWKVYRVLLNRIEQQPGYPHTIEWPASPADATT